MPGPVRVALVVAIVACALAPNLAAAQATSADDSARAELPAGVALPGRVLAVHVGVDVMVQRPDGTVVTVPWADLTVTPWTDAPVHVRVSAGPSDSESRSVDTEEFSRTRRPGDVPLVLLSNGAPLMISVVDEMEASVWGIPSAPTSNPRMQESAFHHTLCTTPCTLYTTPGGHSFYAGGLDRVGASTSVQVAPGGSRVVLRSVHPLRPIGALATLTMGFPFSIGGLVLAGVGIDGEMHGGMVSGTCSASVSGTGGGYASSSNCDAGGLLVTGSVMAAAGVALVATGIVLARHSRTGVERTEPLAGIPILSTRRGTIMRLLGVGAARTEDGRGALGTVGFAF